MAGITLLPIFLAFAVSSYLSRLTLAPLPFPAWQSAMTINESYLPETAIQEGTFAPNTKLQSAVKLFKGRVNGTESVAVAEDGSLYLPDCYGSILRATLTGPGLVPQLDDAAVLFLGGGRPLGAHFDSSGNLYVCLPPVGLVMVEAGTKRTVVLTAKVDAQDPQHDRTARINYPNDLAIDEETGDIYFTDSSDIGPALGQEGYFDTMFAYLMTSFVGMPSGRVLKYSTTARTTTVVADKLWYPNGIALSADRSFLVVAETPSKRLRRIALSGARAGRAETLLGALPGYPDGVSSAPSGGFWVTLVSPSQPPWLEKYVMPRKALRALVANLLTVWSPKFKASGQVFKVSEAGVPQDYLQDPTGKHVASVSAAVQVGDRLYLGNLGGDYISYVTVPAATATS